MSMLARLRALEDDLVDRRARAVEEGWLGEIDGLDLTLRLLREKQAAATPGRARAAIDRRPTASPDGSLDKLTEYAHY